MQLLSACYCILWLSCRPWMFLQLVCSADVPWSCLWKNVRMVLQEWSLYVQKAHFELSIWFCDLWKSTAHLKLSFKIIAVTSNPFLVASDLDLNIPMPEFKKLEKYCLSYFLNFSFPNTFSCNFSLYRCTEIAFEINLYSHRVLFHWCAAQTVTMSEFLELDCSGMKKCAL